MLKNILVSLAAAVATFAPALAGALEGVPLATANRGVLVQVYGLPAAEKARLAPVGGLETALTTEAANSYVQARAGDEVLVLDGETYRWNLSLRRRLTDNLDAGVEVPFLLHAGGFLDGFIDDWHSTFGLPTGGRENTRRGRLLYRYDSNGRTLVNRTASGGGLGDVRLSAGYRLFEDRQRALTLRAGLKLPTGDPDRLAGSGSVDGSLSLAGSAAASTGWGTFTAFGSAGGLGMTRGDILPDRQRTFVGFGTIGGSWSPWEPVGFTLQVNAHSPFYRSGIDELSSSSAQLVIGGSIAVSGSTSVDLGVVEDLAVGTAPDVVFHFALRQLF